MLIPDSPLIKITIDVEAFNAFVLPIVLGFLLILVNDKSILGDRRNSLPANIITGGLSIIIVGLGIWMAYMTFTGQAG